MDWGISLALFCQVPRDKEMPNFLCLKHWKESDYSSCIICFSLEFYNNFFRIRGLNYHYFVLMFEKNDFCEWILKFKFQ